MGKEEISAACTTFKDKYTRGQVRTVRVRDADMLLEQIEQARKDAAVIQSQDSRVMRQTSGPVVRRGLAPRAGRGFPCGVITRPWQPSP